MMLDPRLLWPIFLGLIFVLMGVSLAADAPFHAASALDWQKETQPTEAREVPGLLWMYRGFGAAFAGAGVWILAAWVFARAALFDRLGAPSLGPATGGALLVCGGGAALLKPAGRRAPAFVEAELPAQPLATGRRVSTWCRRLILALVFSYGVLLVLRSPT